MVDPVLDTRILRTWSRRCNGLLSIKGECIHHNSQCVSRLDPLTILFRYLWISNNSLMSEQKGVFRVNCIDCLDRTNVVQVRVPIHEANSSLTPILVCLREICFKSTAWCCCLIECPRWATKDRHGCHIQRQCVPIPCRCMVHGLNIATPVWANNGDAISRA